MTPGTEAEEELAAVILSPVLNVSDIRYKTSPPLANVLLTSPLITPSPNYLNSLIIGQLYEVCFRFYNYDRFLRSKVKF